MNTRNRIAAALALAALTVSLAACTSSSGKTAKTTAAGTSSAVSPTTSPSLGGSSTTPTPTPTPTPTVAVPTAAVLTESLRALLDPSVPVARKLTTIVGGTGLGPTLTKVVATVTRQGGAGTVAFTITGITATSTTAHAAVDVLLSGKSVGAPYPGTWMHVGGTWELTRAGFCAIAPAAAVSCPTTAGG